MISVILGRVEPLGNDADISATTLPSEKLRTLKDKKDLVASLLPNRRVI
jgi:hypothetical protein